MPQMTSVESQTAVTMRLSEQQKTTVLLKMCETRWARKLRSMRAKLLWGHIYWGIVESFEGLQYPGWNFPVY